MPVCIRFKAFANFVANEGDRNTIESLLCFGRPLYIVSFERPAGRLVKAGRILGQVILEGRLGPAPATAAEFVELARTALALEPGRIAQIRQHGGRSPYLRERLLPDIAGHHSHVWARRDISTRRDAAILRACHTPSALQSAKPLVIGDLLELRGAFRPDQHGAVLVLHRHHLPQHGVRGDGGKIVHLLPPARLHQKVQVEGPGAFLSRKRHQFRDFIPVHVHDGRLHQHFEAMPAAYLEGADRMLPGVRTPAKCIVLLRIDGVDADAYPLDTALHHLARNEIIDHDPVRAHHHPHSLCGGRLRNLVDVPAQKRLSAGKNEHLRAERLHLVDQRETLVRSQFVFFGSTPFHIAMGALEITFPGQIPGNKRGAVPHGRRQERQGTGSFHRFEGQTSGGQAETGARCRRRTRPTMLSSTRSVRPAARNMGITGEGRSEGSRYK